VARDLNVFDRLRIERVVWALDQRLYDLPRASRIAKRREVRQNLVSAAHDVGVRSAIVNLGDGRRLADEYIAAELGDGPRHSWTAAGLFCASIPLLLNWVLEEAMRAYADGVVAASSTVTGRFTWAGFAYVQSAVHYTFTGGRVERTGGAWTPLLYVLWLTGTIAVGRLWRALPMWRRRGGSTELRSSAAGVSARRTPKNG
jgi:hypothetical protein